MPKILHFADAHIDMANYGRHDPASGLPLRVLDFLKSLDTIIDAAITEGVDLVIFAGDTYKDRNPAPTFQREWGKRMMRLSQAGIPTLLLVGNHDLSPAAGRANAIQEYETLSVPHVMVLAKPAFLKPADLEGLPLQVIALPWIMRSSLLAALDLSVADPALVNQQIEVRLTELVKGWLDQADPDLPVLLTAHASIQGAKYGAERSVMLGSDWVLAPSLVRDPRLDYVAMGHIHKPQDLNEGSYPPVIYPGSIERVDFGEASDDKYYIIAEVQRGKTTHTWRKLTGIRPFIDRSVELASEKAVSEQLVKALPPVEELTEAIVRLMVTYPRPWEALIDEAAIREYAAPAFEFQLLRRPLPETRIRLAPDQTISSLTALELLDKYWQVYHTDPEESRALNQLASEIIHGSLPE